MEDLFEQIPLSAYESEVEPAPEAVTARPLPSDTVLAADARTEVANGRRFAHMFRDQVLFVPEWNQWLIWDGSRWRPDRANQVDALAKVTLREMFGLATDMTGDDRKFWLQFCTKSAQRAGISSMLHLATSEPGMSIEPGKLDKDPWLFGVINGVIDLRAKAPDRFRPGRPQDLLTKQSVVWYDPAATCPRWDQFVLEICDGDVELAAFIQRALGYSLTGQTREEKVFFLWGPGRNGKSKLINAVVELMGDYATMAADDLLVMGQGDSHPQKLAALHGARLVVAAEVGGRRVNTQLLKALSGGDLVKCRRMRENEWSFWPTLTLWMTDNTEPVVTEKTVGFWERMVKIPLRVVIPAAKRDLTLADTLRAEYAGILNWLIAGCVAWETQGLGSSEAVTAETELYRSNSDTVGAFIEECLFVEEDVVEGGVVVSKKVVTYTSDIFHAYQRWTAEQGIQHPMTARKLTQDLRGRGFGYEAKHGARKVGAFEGLGVAAHLAI